jgi:hypothetical protein
MASATMETLRITNMNGPPLVTIENNAYLLFSPVTILKLFTAETI